MICLFLLYLFSVLSYDFLIKIFKCLSIVLLINLLENIKTKYFKKIFN